MPKKDKKYDIVRYEEKEEPKATAKADFTGFTGVGIPKGTEMYIMIKTRAPGSKTTWNAQVRIDNGTGIKSLMPIDHIQLKKVKVHKSK